MNEVERFLSRGVENIFPSKESLASALASGKKLSIYLGIDPTGPTLHIGHAIPLLKLSKLQKMGHKVILLIGDFTAMIGDPSDKLAVRKQLTKREVLSNLKLYKKQASIFLSFSGKNKAEIKYNSSWLSKMNFEDVLNLASKMTVDQMLKRDMFRKRAEEGKPTFIHEFLYPLMQGYDSVAMNVDAEIGGNDQTFNMLAGRDLMKVMRNKEKFVIATKLLTDSSGVKMGKTEGNMITLTDTAQDMFGKIMSWPDSLIVPGFELCTDVADKNVAKEKEFLVGGGNPRDAKLRLAEAVVALYHGSQVAKSARESFISVFSSRRPGVMPTLAREIFVRKGTTYIDAFVDNRISGSRTVFRRLVSDGAVKDMESGRAIENFDGKIECDMDLRYGQHNFLKIRIR
ncbi:MAG: tyrosine--tRNA ligase [Patescibacteria group bacterium]